MTQPAITLIGLPRSVYTRIARLALEEKGVPYRLEEVEIFGPEGVPASHLKHHPFGKIPVLMHADFTLYETAAICHYIDEAHPGPALQATTPRERARTTQIISLLDAYAYRPMVWGVFVQRVRIPRNGGQANEAEIATALSQARTALKALSPLTTLSHGSPYLAGTTPTLADLHAYPMLRYFELAPEGADAIAEHPQLEEWLERMKGRRSVRKTVSRYEDAPMA